MERLSTEITETTRDRMRRWMRGEVACCACGCWHARVNSQTAQNGRDKWYCGYCGALIRPARRQWARKFLLLLFLLMLAFPFIVRVLNGFTDDLFLSVLFLIFAGWFFFLGFVTIFLSRRYGRALQTRLVEPHGHCLQCDYNLRGTVGDVCPECGAPAKHVIVAITKWRRRDRRNAHE